MNEVVTVYGFGSFFNGACKPSDVDLLLLHQSTSAESCRFAIACKRRIQSALSDADVVILSAVEVESSNFLFEADAVELCALEEGYVETQIQTLVASVQNRRRP